MKKWWRSPAAALRSVCIVDRFLILFMLLLFAYTGHHLFHGAAAVQETNAVDVIVRTSMASIFGYFLSNNMVRTRRPAPPVSAPAPADSQGREGEDSGQPRGKIGFSGASSRPIEGAGGIQFSQEEPPQPQSCSRLQVTVVSLVGLASLGTLLASRAFCQATPEGTAIVSQLRDFVSASIGFLVSCGKNSPS